MSNNDEDLLKIQDLDNQKAPISTLPTKRINKLPLVFGGIFLVLFLVVITLLVFDRSSKQNQQLDIASKSLQVNPSIELARNVIKQAHGLIEKPTESTLTSNRNDYNDGKFEYTTTNANHNNVTNNQSTQTHTNIINNAQDLTDAQKQEIISKLRQQAETDLNLANLIDNLSDEEILQLIADGKLAPVVLDDGTVFGNKANIVAANAPIIDNIHDLTDAQKQEIISKLRQQAETDLNLANLIDNLSDEEILQLIADGKLAPVVLDDGTVFGNKALLAIKVGPASNNKTDELSQADQTMANAKAQMQAKVIANLRQQYPALANFGDADLLYMRQQGTLEKMNQAALDFDKARLEEDLTSHDLGDAEPSKEDEIRDAIAQMRMQMFQQAITAKTTVSFEATKGKDDPYKNTNASFSQFGQFTTQNAVQQSRRQQLQSEIETVRQDLANNSDGNYEARALQIASNINNQQNLGQQTNNGLLPQGVELAENNNLANSDQNSLNQAQATEEAEEDRWALGHKIQAPRTPYELRAGFVISAVLIRGVNSDLPGQVTAQVSQNVYDTPTGQHLLIPQGSRLVGAYTNDINFGQARIMVAWQRIIFPDGKALDLGSMPGADQAGYAGLHDKVNNHYGSVKL